MSHPIYFNKICNDAMFLEQLASGSKNYISTIQDIYQHDKKHDWEVTELDLVYEQYVAWLYENVSVLLIQCATQTRIYQDSYSNKYDLDLLEKDEEPYSSDKESYEYFSNVVEVISGKFSYSLRECCNKIIHANNFELEFISSENILKYWNGTCSLKGHFGKNDWHLKLDVFKFCCALKYFYDTEKYL
ncbi:TPA: hypothetical protein ACX6R8_000944 [Photobacterium damselae]